MGRDIEIMRAKSRPLAAFGSHLASAVTRVSLSLLVIATGLQDIAFAAEAAKPAKSFLAL